MYGYPLSMGPFGTEDRTGLTRQRDHEAGQHELVQRKKVKYALDDDAVGANEIASAFALASLASMSQDSMMVEARDVENNQAHEESRTEAEPRSPIKEETSLICPDERPAPMIRRMSSGSKSVTFAPDTVHVERHLSRRVQVLPRIMRDHSFRPPLPDGFVVRRSMPASVPTHHPANPQWIRHRQTLPPWSVPPQILPRAPSNQWICDFCNVAAFATYEEACVHEQTCRSRCASAISGASWGQNHAERGVQLSSAKEWFTGSVPLALPQSDSEWLSELNCFIRSHCVEAFTATEEFINRSSKRGPITLHQVGIRCRFCAHRACDRKAVAAISFPATLAGLYESVKRWHRVHLEVCLDVPPETKRTIAMLAAANTWTTSTRHYWVDSAKALGLIDTKEGIRFVRDPHAHCKPDLQVVEKVVPDSPEPSSTSSTGPSISQSLLADGDPIVEPDDAKIVPAYVFFLMSQVERCRFTEADRFVARSKGPVGYPGFQCRHCNGHAGLGKYFPVTSKSLSTNSTSQNIHAHLLKCRKCPPELKQQLVVLKEEKSKAPRLEPGWRKVFFDRIWTRLHGQGSG